MTNGQFYFILMSAIVIFTELYASEWAEKTLLSKLVLRNKYHIFLYMASVIKMPKKCFNVFQLVNILFKDVR